MKHTLIFLFCLFVNQLFSQKFYQERYKNFDKRLFHFGFMLGTNTSDFTKYEKLDVYNHPYQFYNATYSLQAIKSNPTIGGQLGILTTLKLGTPLLKLRFMPTLSFEERVLNYTFEKITLSDTVQYFKDQRVNSTNLSFPFILMFRAKRLNNFTAYALIGGSYSLDLQSQENSAQNYFDPFLKIRKHDFQGQIGGGLEFFAPYFKFAVELKYSHGVRNVLIQDQTPFDRPIEKLYNKGWWLSLIFEG
ncbi:MAG: PorT family protein [Flavobacteriia bacterium]|nr:PorT family protein [Flavobacteriia bacterium]